ncbi:hypothetical protein P171DRAFT_489191 [Karstenula rhodostoma CBS 690.94]|uniref:Uncharacterized protein n=1 Tax=Karstenula rhodostoma CBS 690.94 TaxID=1392251 RepID=A0A9P4PC47_9PLEO|nr:hypothetical protein P171DRAFT_489191 [Karstenula rhodostoma CBS 690.94]
MSFDRAPPTGPRGWQANNERGGQQGGDGGRGRGGRGGGHGRGRGRIVQGYDQIDLFFYRTALVGGGPDHSGGTVSLGRGQPVSAALRGGPFQDPTGAQPGPAAPTWGQDHGDEELRIPARSVTPVNNGAPRREVMRKPNPETDPMVFYPPVGPHVDQADLPDAMGDRLGHIICPHCLTPYGPGYTDSRTGDKACVCYHSKDHQGGYCRQRYMSWEVYNAKLGRPPYKDERVKFRPTHKDIGVMANNGIRDWDNLPSVLESKKRKREADDEAGLEDDRVTAKKNQRAANALAGYRYLVTAWSKKVQVAQNELREVKAQLEQKDEEILELRAALERFQGGGNTSRSLDERFEDMMVDEAVEVVKQEEEEDGEGAGQTGRR